MIFGEISLNNDINTFDYQSIYRELGFCNAHEENLTHKNVNVSYLHHVDLPKNNNWYYIDDEKELILILDGELYAIDPFDDNAGISNPTNEQIATYYKKYGDSFFHALNGEFALCILDSKNENYLFVKDHIGTTPLSVAKKNGNIYFASDTNGLSKALFQDEPIDNDFIVSRFYNYVENYHFTPNNKLVRILPGHFLSANYNFNQNKYWQPGSIDIDHTIDFEEATTQIEDRIKNAIQTRAKQGYTIGSHISGGLDSTLITVLLKKFLKEKTVHAYSWSPDKTTADISKLRDERIPIRKQCEKENIQLHFSEVLQEDYDAFVHDWRHPSELIFERAVFRNAKKNGINMLLSGWGGDDFVGLRDEALIQDVFHHLKFGQFFKLNRKKGLKNGVMHLVNNIILPTRRRVYFKHKCHPEVFPYVQNGMRDNSNEQKSGSLISRKNYQVAMINYHHIAQRCEDWYIHGKRNGIVYRYPMLDKGLVEYSLKIPTKHFVSATYDRPLMREIALKYLTNDIATLVKTGDPVAMRHGIDLQTESLRSLEEELSEMKDNHYLEFIDFKQLIRDVDQNGFNPNKFSGNLRFFLFQLRSTHYFVKNYSGTES